MKKDNKCKRISALIIIVIMGILMLVYFTFCYIFQTHYFFHTTIDYIESSVQTVDTVSDILKDEFQKYSLHVIGREDTEVTISAEDVSLKVDTQDALQEIMDSQNAWLWPVSIWKEYSYDLEHIGQYEEDVLEQIIDTIPFMKRDYMKAPQNAYIGDFQESTGQYELVKAYPGTYLRKGKVCDSIKLALENMDTELNLEEAGCYIEPSITSEDKEIYIGGHSKGGNLAMTSVMYIKEDIFNRIKTIYNLDGPGFRDKEYTSSNFKKILPKLQVYVPEDTIVGMLLNTSNNKYIVKSTARGVLSHNMNTWQCFGEFLEKGKQSKLSITIDNRIKSWFKNYNDKEIKRMINAIFNILENNNIKEFKEIKNLKWNQIVKIINEVNDIDSATKKLYLDTIKDLIWVNTK